MYMSIFKINKSSCKHIFDVEDVKYYNKFKTRMVVHGQLVKPAVCLGDLYDVFC